MRFAYMLYTALPTAVVGWWHTHLHAGTWTTNPANSGCCKPAANSQKAQTVKLGSTQVNCMPVVAVSRKSNKRSTASTASAQQQQQVGQDAEQ